MEAQNALKQLPADHFRGIPEVRFVSRWGANGEYFFFGKGSFGGRTARDRVPVFGIVVREHVPWGESRREWQGMKGTAVHEVGHHVHLALLNGAAASEWARIDLNNRDGRRVSSYAHMNCAEHFAEAYRAWHSPPESDGTNYRDRLKTVEPEAHAFMARLHSADGAKMLVGKREAISMNQNIYRERRNNGRADLSDRQWGGREGRFSARPEATT